MSFSTTRLARSGNVKEESAGNIHLKGTASRTSVRSHIPLKSSIQKSSVLSGNLTRSKSGVSAIKETSVVSDGKSKIPNQSSKPAGFSSNKYDAKKPFPVVTAIDKSRIIKTPKAAISSALSTPSTAPNRSAAHHAIHKVSPHKGVVGVRSTPSTARKDNPVPHSRIQSRKPPNISNKPAFHTGSKENTFSNIEKEKTIVLEGVSLSVKPNNFYEAPPDEKKEVEKNSSKTSLNKVLEQPDQSPPAVFDNLQILLSVLSEESMSFCDQILNKRANLLTNFIINNVEILGDNIQDEKLANYLEEGDGLHMEHDSLQKSHKEAIEKILNIAKEITSENISLKTLHKKSEQKLGLLEEENKDMMTQIKLFSEELETEKQKSAASNQRKTQLEQQIRKYCQRVKELEEKSQKNDEQISHQSSQLKDFEIQLKQKEEKYHTLEMRFNRQVKQLRSMVDARDKLENQREILESRVKDFKKQKNDWQNEHLKAMESITTQFNEAVKSLNAEKTQRMNLEKELKETQERLMKVQEESLELTDITDLSKAVGKNEIGSLSENEVKLFKKLEEFRTNFDGATHKIECLEQENEKLRTTLLQYMEQNKDNKDIIDEESLIGILKSDLGTKEKIIEQLQKQIAVFHKEVKERDACIEELKKKKEQSVEGNQSESSNAEDALWLEIHQLQQRLEEGASLNINLKQQLVQKQLEVEQRENIMREQAKVLQVRDELLLLLKDKDEAKTEQLAVLQAKLEEHEQNVYTVSKFFSKKSEQMEELYSTLEMKQKKVMQLEEQVKELEAQQERGQFQRTHLEARIAELELALHDKAYISMTYIPRSHEKILL